MANDERFFRGYHHIFGLRHLIIPSSFDIRASSFLLCRFPVKSVTRSNEGARFNVLVVLVFFL